MVASTWMQSTMGAVVEIGPNDDIQAAIAGLQPGDELVLDGGTYELSSRLGITAVGEADQPVVIRGRDGQTALLHRSATNQNIVDVESSRYLILRNLVFRGGSQGIRLTDSDYITIENCEIYETDDVAIAANSGGTYEGLTIRKNHIHHTSGTGEGMYLGCNNDACRVMNSLIEGNYIHHTNGPTVEQGDGIEIKEGSAGNIIRDNVIHDTNYPGILTYSTVGNGPPNLIEGNLMWGSNDNGMQVAADAIIRNNIVLGAPVAFQSHQAGTPSNLVFVHNTVIVDGDAVNVRDVSGSVVIANNAVYSNSGSAIRLISGNTGLVTVAGNVGSGGLTGASSGYTEGNGIAADFVDGHFGGAPPIDLFPADGGALIGAGSASHVVDLDFNGAPRNGAADVGAYSYQSGGNPGWPLSAAFKDSAAAAKPNPPTALSAE